MGDEVSNVDCILEDSPSKGDEFVLVDIIEDRLVISVFGSDGRFGLQTRTVSLIWSELTSKSLDTFCCMLLWILA